MTGAANTAPTASANALFFFIPPAPLLSVCFFIWNNVFLVGTTPAHATSARYWLSTMKGATVSCAQQPGRSATVVVELVPPRLEGAAELARHARLRQRDSAVGGHLGDDRHVV